MPPSAASPETHDSTKPTTCTQCGERVDRNERQPTTHEKPLCVDCAFENVPFTD
jgi:hypothetical protein